MKNGTLYLTLLLLCSCDQNTFATTHTKNTAINSRQPVVHSDDINKLYQHYQAWKDTPYQLGGTSKNGIDCSGFVAMTFESIFNFNLPRSTQAQSQLKSAMQIDDGQRLLTGDLIFFDIPKQKDYYHVGIYLENQKFLHASTSKGVTISNLKSAYWKSSYWKVIRVTE